MPLARWSRDGYNFSVLPGRVSGILGGLAVNPPLARMGRSEHLDQMALFADSLLSEIQSRGEAVNGSFLVSILVRDEPQIRLFREAMEEWFRQVPDTARQV